MEQETIVAVSTAAGRGGIGIVRLSGAEARAVVEPMLRLKRPLEAGRARFGEVLDVTGCGSPEDASAGGVPGSGAAVVLDQVVVTYFAGPNSYTGEDVVEIAMHGAPVLLEHVVRQCCGAGAGPDAARARVAEAGEFTQRAFLAGRIDLTQAEAVDDLIAASTLEQARVAARQMGGSLARVVGPVKERLVELIATLEAGIDFAEDEIDVMPAEAIVGAIDGVLGPLRVLEASFARGRIVREGLRLAIVGRPNAGKSSLFNRLVERERAIVTARPGTTRDTVSERVSLGGIPVELIDTAGLREAEDEAERLGIARSREAMAEADLVLLVVDATAGVSGEDAAVVEEHREGGRPLLVVWNKWDLVGEGEVGAGGIRTSAVTGEGVEELRRAIVQAVGAGLVGNESGMLTSLRQHQAVQAGIAGAERARAAVEVGIPHEMVLLDMYEGLRGLDALTGATTTEDVLRVVFSRFCIGK